MSERMVNDLTLQYFTSRDFGSKIQRMTTPEGDDEMLKDKKFYRKRVIDLSKKMLNKSVGRNMCGENEPDVIPNDVKTTFENYVRSCVDYFKFLDQSEIMQEEYDTMVCHEDMESRNKVENYAPENVDEMFLRSIHMKSEKPLDRFVLKKHTKPNTPERDLPRERNINLNSPSLKIKGIKKKKNLRNKYEDAPQKTSQDQETSKVTPHQQN
jgi:hypothetical protein